MASVEAGRHSVDGEGHHGDVVSGTMLRFSEVFLLPPRYLDDGEHEFSGHDDRTLGLFGDTGYLHCYRQAEAGRRHAAQEKSKVALPWQATIVRLSIFRRSRSNAKNHCDCEGGGSSSVRRDSDIVTARGLV